MRPRPALLATALLALGCSRSDPTAAARAEPSAASAGDHATPVVARGVRFVKAPAGDDVAKLVRDERDRTAAEGRALVVYVGASWCEPCVRFHVAAARGELDDAFPTLTLLEFDADDDRDRLVAAGYVPKLIPFFVVPTADGLASERRFEGGVKGDRAVGHLTPRLRAILAD